MKSLLKIFKNTAIKCAGVGNTLLKIVCNKGCILTNKFKSQLNSNLKRVKVGLNEILEFRVRSDDSLIQMQMLAL